MASLYIHIPFCEHKCIYCDFYSIVPDNPGTGNRDLEKKFLSSLKTEIELRVQEARFNEPFETVFLGGGTPSLLPPAEIENLLGTLASRFSIDSNAEITLETNPGTVNKKKLQAFKSAGINRISLGVQSFNDDELKFLTRIHNASEARQCIEDCLSAGFENISFDLIFSLPGQKLSKWKSTLEQAVQFHPPHISCYSLIVEPETPLFQMIHSRQVIPIDTESDADMYEFTIDYLASNGYEQYEISNFAKPAEKKGHSYKCRHNLNYWNHSNYLGFGPSAHSFWSYERWWNISSLSDYMEKLNRNSLPVSGGEHLNTNQLMEESIFLGLRSEGIDLAKFRQDYSRDFKSDNESTISELVAQKKILAGNERVRLTSKGYLICDEICQMLH